MSDHIELKRLAEAATQCSGPRRVETDYNGVHQVVGDGSWKILNAWHTPDGKGLENAKFAAAASPAAVLALIDENERLERETGRVNASWHGMKRDMDQLKAENARSTEREILQLAEIEALRKLVPSKEIIWCACGDGYPVNSHGAGFMDANDGVCANCDAAMGKGEQS